MALLIKKFELNTDELKELRQRLDDIAAHKRVVSALERSLFHYVKEQFGIDLDAENWTLNVDEGFIEYNGTA